MAIEWSDVRRPISIEGRSVGLPGRRPRMTAGHMRGASVREKIEAYSIPEPNSGCWLWIGTYRALGYGNVRVGRKIVPAHRASYEAYVGKIPEGLHIDHLCRNPSCVNPGHLEAVTNRENAARGMAGILNAHRQRDPERRACKHGHPLTPENTYVSPKNSHRFCRECNRLCAQRRRDNG